MPSEKKDSYEVGYGKPPRHTRFAQGQSGNPRGRPAGAKNLRTLLSEALNEPVVVTENGGRRKVSKRQAIITQLVNRSATADFRAIKILLDIMRDIERQAESTTSETSDFSEADEKVLEQIKGAFRERETRAMKVLTRAEYEFLLRHDLATFAGRCFQDLNPQTCLATNWHLEVIAAKLTAVREGRIPRLIINLPPRHLKSLLASIAFPAWCLGHDPSAQILCVSYAQDLADKLARDCRSIMMSPWYRRIFPTRLAPHRQAVQEFITTRQGYRLATSTGGALTGRGAADIILIDDPLKPEEALSDAQRQAANDWFDHTLYSRINDKRYGAIVIIMQRLHEDDLVGHVVKPVKRAMAGEYSRELSAKVFAGQCRLMELGFRQGGHAGYGLRRRLVDQNGNPKATLAFGEQKSLQTDRVVLEPGPVEEVETVRRMFRMFVHEEKHQREIAAILNKEQIRTDLGRRWTAGSVHQVLTNEKYIGNNVFNRASAKLTNKRIANPPEMWVRAIGVFPAIVDPELFRAARARLAMRNRHLSDDEMLALLRDLYAKHGRLSSIIIDQAKDLPVSLTYRQRFGSLGRVYRLVGYVQQRADGSIEINRTLRRVHADVYREIISKIEQLGGAVARDGPKGLITINGEFTGSIVIARCLSTRGGGAMRWNLRLDTALRPDITIAVRLAPDNEQPLDYYLLPHIDIKASRLRVAQRNAIFLDAYRFDTLHRFFQISARTRLGSVE